MHSYTGLAVGEGKAVQQIAGKLRSGHDQEIVCCHAHDIERCMREETPDYVILSRETAFLGNVIQEEAERMGKIVRIFVIAREKIEGGDCVTVFKPTDFERLKSEIETIPQPIGGMRFAPVNRMPPQRRMSHAFN